MLKVNSVLLLPATAVIPETVSNEPEGEVTLMLAAVRVET